MDKKVKNYKFFQNKDCEFFPCHNLINYTDKFNCLFCYCPLYSLGDKCGGHFRYNIKGIKDCSKCNVPHIKEEGYDFVLERIGKVVNNSKK